jgi:hypothetical protein
MGRTIVLMPVWLLAAAGLISGLAYLGYPRSWRPERDRGLEPCPVRVLGALRYHGQFGSRRFASWPFAELLANEDELMLRGVALATNFFRPTRITRSETQAIRCHRGWLGRVDLSFDTGTAVDSPRFILRERDMPVCARLAALGWPIVW